MELHQIKKLLHVKDKNYQNEQTIPEREKICVSFSSDKRLMSRIHKELKKLNT
jgi:hypothetical protein